VAKSPRVVLASLRIRSTVHDVKAIYGDEGVGSSWQQ
jgi:hypothetical protein